MSGEERLFDAIGGVDETLLERSERARKRSPWLGWGIGIAACLVLAAVWVLPGAFGDKTPPVTAADDLPPSDCTPEQEDPDNICVSPYEPWPPEDGETHYLQLRAEAGGPELQFRIYINKEVYYTYEREGVYTIRPLQEAEGLPECKLEISHIADAGLDQALERVKTSLTGLYAEIEELPGPPNGWYEVDQETQRFLFASAGTDWDSAQREVLLVDDRAGGVYVLSASYFMEATEGHGARFVDMMECFAPYTAGEERWVDWERDLLDAGERLAEAAFAGDLSSVADLLAEDAEVSGYGGDVSGSVSVANIDYSCNRDVLENGVTVSVKHRLGGEEPYRFLTMELAYTDGVWKAGRISLAE